MVEKLAELKMTGMKKTKWPKFNYFHCLEAMFKKPGGSAHPVHRGRSFIYSNYYTSDNALGQESTRHDTTIKYASRIRIIINQKLKKL